MNKVARLRIWRGKAGDAGRYDEFDVAFQDGESVLDGLVKIRSTDAPDLAFQFSCFNANVCKECAVQINGAVEYACIAKLVSGFTQLDPVPGQRILRDLFIETREREQKGATLRHQMLSLRTGRSH